MSRGDTLSLVDALGRARDDEQILEAARRRTGSLPRKVRSWRLFPIRKGGFAVRYELELESREVVTLHGLVRDEEDAASEGPAGFPVELFDARTDPRLRGLDEVIDGTALRDVVPEARFPGALVSYRPLARAAVRFEVPSAPPVFARVSASRRRFARTSRLARLSTELGDLFPKVHVCDENRRMVVISGVPGRTLHEILLDETNAVGAAEVETVARSVAALHGAAAPELPVHHALDEAEAASWMLRRAAIAEPALLAGVARDLEALFEIGSSVEPKRVKPIHRDLHDKQIVVAGDRARLIDTDTLVLGDPMLDLGNLLAHVELRALQGRLAPGRAEAIRDGLRREYAALCESVAERNLTYYQACTWLRLAGVYALRSRGRTWVPDLLTRGRAALLRLSRPADPLRTKEMP